MRETETDHKCHADTRLEPDGWGSFLSRRETWVGLCCGKLTTKVIAEWTRRLEGEDEGGTDSPQVCVLVQKRVMSHLEGGVSDNGEERKD